MNDFDLYIFELIRKKMKLKDLVFAEINSILKEYS
jgi:hypothetical protein